jgi:hypothetical protein
MVVSVALVVCQLKVVAWPCWTTLGVAVKVAVGEAGGGGGATDAIFLLLHAVKNSMPANTIIKADDLRF